MTDTIQDKINKLEMEITQKYAVCADKDEPLARFAKDEILDYTTVKLRYELARKIFTTGLTQLMNEGKIPLDDILKVGQQQLDSCNWNINNCETKIQVSYNFLKQICEVRQQ